MITNTSAGRRDVLALAMALRAVRLQHVAGSAGRISGGGELGPVARSARPSVSAPGAFFYGLYALGLGDRLSIHQKHALAVGQYLFKNSFETIKKVTFKSEILKINLR